jgi:hypothetical protein
LADAGRDQLTFLLPRSDPGYARDAEVNVRHTPVVVRNRVDEDAERLVYGWVIVSAGAGKMRASAQKRAAWRLEARSETRVPAWLRVGRVTDDRL